MQKLRITEQDLHKIVSESVKRIITELDWNTYANASDLAYRRGEKKRAKRFNDASVDSFNRKYADSSKTIDFNNMDSDNNYDISMVSKVDDQERPYRDLDITIGNNKYNLDNIDQVKTYNKRAAKSLSAADDAIADRQLGSMKYGKNNMINRIQGKNGWRSTRPHSPNGWRIYHQDE